MRGTDLEYNESLNVLISMYSKDKDRRRLKTSKQIKELLFINNNIKRVYEEEGIEKGYFKYAIFTNSIGESYKVTNDGEIYKNRSGIYERLQTSKKDAKHTNGNQYRIIRFSSTEKKVSIFIELHILMMVCAYSNFLDLYLSHTTFVVNHTKIASNAKERTNDYDAIYNLEIVTRGENAIHGKFCKNYGLLNTHVEFKDISSLKPLVKYTKDKKGKEKEELIKNNKEIVKKYYIIRDYEQHRREN